MPPLACQGADAAACPVGYRCVADPTANCDPATGMECAGICVLGEPLPGCGAIGTKPCPDGYACADDPADDCDGEPAVDCPGVCRPVVPSACTDDAQCPVLEASCAVCADGSLSCPASRCVDGACSVETKPCGAPEPCAGIAGLPCQPGFVCVDDPADDCAPERGGADCGGICLPDAPPRGCGETGAACPPGFECAVDSMCERADGACPSICRPVNGDECESDAECPSIPVPCSRCADGIETCPRAFCDGGRCTVAFPSCPPPPGCTSDADCDAGSICVSPDGQLCDPAMGATNCGGVCIPKEIERPCGDGGTTCPAGYQCAVDHSDGCEPDAAGNGCPNICVPEAPPSCTSNDECAGIQSCQPCPDGQLSCAVAECRDGVCIGEPPRCQEPGQCQADSDCGVMEACSRCADGSLSCPAPACHNGVCVPRYPACNDPTICGGIAGIPCLPGFTCIDDPADDCDPNQGGADCGGVCRREDEPRRCGNGNGNGMACPIGYECADAPDGCDPATGVDCAGVCRPTPPPPCTSDQDCAVIAAPCQMCADGTAGCPQSTCVNGQCETKFPCGRNDDPTAR